MPIFNGNASYLFSHNTFSRDNYLKAYIYYEELGYELMEQKPSYPLFSYLGMNLYICYEQINVCRYESSCNDKDR